MALTKVPLSMLSVGSVGTTVSSVAAMLALDGKAYKSVGTLAYYADTPGGAASYYADLNDTTSASDGGSVHVGADGTRWKMIKYALVGSKQFGARGDYVQDDTPFLNKWLAFLTAGAALRQTAGFWQGGMSKITGDGLSVNIADTMPMMYTDGAESTILKGDASALITFRAVGGSGQIILADWMGLRLDGVTATAGREGVCNEGLCFFTLKGWHFYNLDIAGRALNARAGSFTEGWVFEDCYFHTSCKTWLRYSRLLGNDSFRSTGLRNCKGNIGPTSQPILIDDGCVPYFAPMDVTLWNFNANCTFIMNMGGSQVPMVGNITIETQGSSANKITLSGGVGYVFLLGGVMGWNFDNDKLVKGKLISVREYWGAPGLGQQYIVDRTSGKKVSTTVGESFKAPAFMGVDSANQPSSAILTLQLLGPGVNWSGVYIVTPGATANILNATKLYDGLLVNTAGVGAPVVSQGNDYGVNIASANTPIGTRFSYTYQYTHGLIPQ